jgi:hypothetical protein
MGYVSWSDKNKIFFVFVFVVDKEGKCDETGEKRGVINTFVFVFVVYKGGPKGVPYVITFYKNKNVFVFAGPF